MEKISNFFLLLYRLCFIFFFEKDEAFSQKTKTQKPKTYRGYGDLLAAKVIRVKKIA
jgi:hypothetical protein